MEPGTVSPSSWAGKYEIQKYKIYSILEITCLANLSPPNKDYSLSYRGGLLDGLN